MTNYIADLLAGELRRRAPHVVPNPEDCYVYCLADELLAEGHETIRTVPADELDARIRANTLQGAEDSPEDVASDDEGDPRPGDVYLTAYGLAVATPCGWWQLSEEDTLKLITRLTVSLHGHLTTPWAADDPSSILSRGRAALTEGCQS